MRLTHFHAKGCRDLQVSTDRRWLLCWWMAVLLRCSLCPSLPPVTPDTQSKFEFAWECTHDKKQRHSASQLAAGAFLQVTHPSATPVAPHLAVEATTGGLAPPSVPGKCPNVQQQQQTRLCPVSATQLVDGLQFLAWEVLSAVSSMVGLFFGCCTF